MNEEQKSCIYVNDMIWADEDLRKLSTGAALRFLFAIAWSRSNRKDGWFSDFAFTICGGSQEELRELLALGLVLAVESPKGYVVRTYEEWQNTNEEIAAAISAKVSASARASASGKVGLAKRWGKPITKLAPDGSFDAEQAAAECFALWPEASEPKYREKRTEAIAAFVSSVLAEDYEPFKKALEHRLQSYSNEAGHERRRFLGAFKNFCLKWQDWIPKDYGLPAPAAPVDDGFNPLAFVDDQA